MLDQTTESESHRVLRWIAIGMAIVLVACIIRYEITAFLDDIQTYLPKEKVTVAPIQNKPEEKKTVDTVTAFIEIDPRDVYIRVLNAYVVDYLSVISQSKSHQKREEDALAAVPYIVDSALLLGVDPLLVAVTARRESSFVPHVIGRMGEIGILQVMPSSRYPAKELKTIEGQIRSGVRKLAEAISHCPGDVSFAIGYYLTGKCGGAKKMSKFRAKDYLDAKKKYSGWSV